MDAEKGRREIVYQATMAAARKMLEAGLVSREQYERFDEEMRRKYEPAIGELFSRISLL